MKRLIASYSLIVLLAAVVTSVHASITIQTVVDEDLHVVLNMESMDPAIYNETVQQGLFDVSTIPAAINANFKQQNLTNARCNYDSAQQIFTDSTTSIRVEFYLTGLDILDSAINADTRTKVYNVRTDWRKFQISLTNETSLDFANHFATPVGQWNKVSYPLNGKSHPAYFYNSTIPSLIDPSFYFILPEKATNVNAVGDKIAFEVPLSFEEIFLNSPFLILAVLLVVIVIVFVYRRIRK